MSVYAKQEEQFRWLHSTFYPALSKNGKWKTQDNWGDFSPFTEDPTNHTSVGSICWKVCPSPPAPCGVWNHRPPTQHWSTHKWRGVWCDENLNVIVLIFDRHSNIVGELPVDIGSGVPHLRAIQMANNHISGTIPWSFGQLKNLQVIQLYGNDMSGLLSGGLFEVTNPN